VFDGIDVTMNFTQVSADVVELRFKFNEARLCLNFSSGFGAAGEFVLMVDSGCCERYDRSAW
jgi:hypothetical protein